MCGARLVLGLFLSLLAWPSFSDSSYSGNEASPSSQAFLDAVTSLNQTMTPTQKSELIMVLRFYDSKLAKIEETLTDSEATIKTLSQRSEKREETLLKLSASLAEERSGNLISDALGVFLASTVANLTAYSLRDAPGVGVPLGIGVGAGLGFAFHFAF